MNTKKHITLLIIFMLGLNSLFAQGFEKPTPGKAVVYFARISGYGAAASFDFFHQDKYFASFRAKNYIKYECEPGKQLFWASSENKEFMTADLEAGKTYIVIVDIIIGAWKGHVGLTPISTADADKFKRACKLINSKKPIITSPEKIEKKNIKLQKFIASKLKTYEEKWKNERNFKHLSSDMAIPKDKMN